MRSLALMVLIAGIARGVAGAAEHAEMRTALREIETARRHLEAARHDYRGHRSTAVAELKEAEEQIRRGIEKAGDAKEKE
jgi:hypothetical protein